MALPSLPKVVFLAGMPVRVTLSNPGGGRRRAGLNGRAHPPKGNMSLVVGGVGAATSPAVSTGRPRRHLTEDPWRWSIQGPRSVGAGLQPRGGLLLHLPGQGRGAPPPRASCQPHPPRRRHVHHPHHSHTSSTYIPDERIHKNYLVYEA